MFTNPYVHRAVKAGAKRSDVPYDQASMLLLGDGSEATEPYNMQTFSNESSLNILAVTALKSSNSNSAVWDQIFISAL